MIKEEFYLNTTDPELSVIEIVQKAIDRRNLSDYALDRIRLTLATLLKERADLFEEKADSRIVNLEPKLPR